MKVNGPYVHSTGSLKGRRYVSILDDAGKRTTKLYSQYLWEQANGPLAPGETVDHIDEDPTNDVLSNLQRLSRKENAKKSAALRRPTAWVYFVCPECGTNAKKKARFVKHAANQGKTGPYCGKSCAGKASHRLT